MRTVSIVSIQGTSNVGGVERVVSQQQSILSKKYRVCIVALPTRGWLGKLRRKSRVAECLALALFPLLASFLARLRAGRDGFVISHGYSSVGISCDLVVMHGCWAAYLERTQARPGLFSYLVLLYEFAAVRFARKVVCVSDSVVPQINRHYRLKRRDIEVLVNSVDTAIFSPSDSEELVCTGRQIRVLFVGRLEPGKGQAYLEALHAELASQSHPISVSVCSPTPIDEKLRERFHLFRFRIGLSAEELKHEYNAADLFLLPSQYEAFELSSIEALACGTPVLLNDTGSRSTLQRLSCPGVFRLEDFRSPLAAIRAASEAFQGLRRKDLAAWTAAHFDQRLSADRFLALCAL
jgi:glycosyltransferase involved in cell wall biosynthesis